MDEKEKLKQKIIEVIQENIPTHYTNSEDKPDEWQQACTEGMVYQSKRIIELIKSLD